MSSHPGRPLEPQQVDNLRKGKPAGAMQDKEVISHAEKTQKPAKAKPAPKEEHHKE
jgi:hypothetical protein